MTLPKTAIIATVVVVAAIVVAFPTFIFFSSFFIQRTHAQFLPPLSQQKQQEASALMMTGQLIFPNGTGTAYFDDGSTSPFTHNLTPEEGYYYDNSTNYYVGKVPGISNNLINAQCRENATFDTGNLVKVKIIRGAGIIENTSRAFEPSPIIKIKAGDTVTWTNEDNAGHWLVSPPSDLGGDVPFATNINGMILSVGETFSCTFSEPGGFLLEDGFNLDLKGAVIVEAR